MSLNKKCLLLVSGYLREGETMMERTSMNVIPVLLERGEQMDRVWIEQQQQLHLVDRAQERDGEQEHDPDRAWQWQ